MAKPRGVIVTQCGDILRESTALNKQGMRKQN